MRCSEPLNTWREQHSVESMRTSQPVNNTEGVRCACTPLADMTDRAGPTGGSSVCVRQQHAQLGSSWVHQKPSTCTTGDSCSCYGASIAPGGQSKHCQHAVITRAPASVVMLLMVVIVLPPAAWGVVVTPTAPAPAAGPVPAPASAAAAWPVVSVARPMASAPAVTPAAASTAAPADQVCSTALCSCYRLHWPGLLWPCGLQHRVAAVVWLRCRVGAALLGGHKACIQASSLSHLSLLPVLSTLSGELSRLPRPMAFSCQLMLLKMSLSCQHQ
jgi:hypothetical protein